MIAGRDPHDATTADVPVPDYTAALTGDLKGARVGFPRALFGEGLDREVGDAVKGVVDVYRDLGVEIVDVDLPHAQYAIAVYYIIATAEASSNLARFDGVRYGFRAEDTPELRQMYRRTREEGFGAEVKRRIMLGTYVLSAGYYDAYYLKAQKVRTLIENDFLGVRTLRRDHHADCADDRFRTRRKGGRSARDVFERYLHGDCEPGGSAGHQRALRAFNGETANRISIAGPYWSEPTLFKLAHGYAGATVHRTSTGFCSAGVSARFFRSALSGMRSPVKISSTFFAVPTTGVTSNPTWTAPGIRPFFRIS